MQDRRLIYALSALAALLTIGVIVLLVVLLSGGDDDDDEGQVAGEDTEEEETPEPTGTDNEGDGDSDDDDDDATPDEDDASPTSTATAEPPPATALEAVGRFLENDGQNFVGECPGPDDPPDNSYCAREAGMSGSQIAFFVGPVFSEFSDEFFVRPEGNGFIVDHIEPAPCGGQAPCPPVIGATVEITTEGCVNARSQPTITASINECVEDGTRAKLVAGPTQADARTWVELEGLGWVSAGFINCVSECE